MKFGLTIVAYVLLCLDYIHTGRRIPTWHLNIAQKQGPNACVVEEVPGTPYKLWTECRYWMTRRICGQKTLIRYECCEGFERINGTEGCSGVKPLKNIVETARDTGATEFVKFIEESGLQKEWTNTREGAFTLFAPTNEAFERVSDELKNRLESYRNNIENPILKYHVLDKKTVSDNFLSDMMIPTLFDGQRLRINKYSNGMLTVNCVKIVRKDQEATNGVVHLIDEVLDPSIFINKDVADIVTSDGRFNVLSQAMEEAAFVNKIRSAGQITFTIFAPSDEAFEKITPQRRRAIMNDKEARSALLQNHVLPHPLCFPAITEEYNMKTLSGKRLKIDCDKKGVSVSGNGMKNEYILGNNGVIHVSNTVLLPNRAKSLLELAQDEGLNTFLELAKIGGFEESLSKFGDYTIFVPSEAAFAALPQSEMDEIQSSQEAAQQFVRYHGTQGRLFTNKIKDSQLHMSLDEENTFRVLVYRKSIGVENALIEKADIEGQNGVLHIVNKVIRPSNISAGDLLRNEGNFTSFLKAMEITDAMDMGQALEASGVDPLSSTSYTFFVPTDSAFQALGKTTLDSLLSDPPRLRQVIQNHIAYGLFSVESFKPELIYNLECKFGSLSVFRTNETVKVNDASLMKADLMNANGVIHVINKVILP